MGGKGSGRRDHTHKPTNETRELVKRLVLLGATQDDIAKHLGGISPVTLRKHYADVLDHYYQEVASTVANRLAAIAMNPNPAVPASITASIFYLKSLHGRNTRKFVDRATEISGPGGEPLKVETTTKIDAANLDPEQRDALRALLLAAAAKKDQA